jgi:hypothetical protein
MTGAGGGRIVVFKVSFPWAGANASFKPSIDTSKLKGISMGAFDLLDDGADRYLLIGREVRLRAFRVDREEIDDGMVLHVEINHARSAALSPARKSHPHLANATSTLDKVSLFRVLLQLVWECAVSVIARQQAQAFAESS